MQNVAPLPAGTPHLWGGRLGSSRLALGAAALGVIAVAAARQWSWLVAIGAVPLPVSIALCAAMCGLGLCMSRKVGRACSPAPKSGQAVRETLRIPSATEET